MVSYEVECPRCNTPYVEEIDDDSDAYEMECEDCGCLFEVLAEVVVDWSATEIEED